MEKFERDKWERKLARLLGGMERAHLAKLLEALGDPPNLGNVPSEFWDEAGEEMRNALTPFLRDIVLERAKALMLERAIGIEWTIVNQAAIDWARRYTFDLVKGINNTSQQAISKALEKYFSESMTRGDLEALLSPIFGPVRAEMIAVTETTRASVSGQDIIAQELEKQGIKMKPVWKTSNDELVCDICGPLNEKEADIYGNGTIPTWKHPDFGEVQIPAHPNCRCDEGYELL